MFRFDLQSFIRFVCVCVCVFSIDNRTSFIFEYEWWWWLKMMGIVSTHTHTHTQCMMIRYICTMVFWNQNIWKKNEIKILDVVYIYVSCFDNINDDRFLLFLSFSFVVVVVLGHYKFFSLHFIEIQSCNSIQNLEKKLMKMDSGEKILFFLLRPSIQV